MAFKTEAIVLRERVLRGADRIYEILTPYEGKLSVVARSVGKSSSRMSGHLQPFAHVKLMIGRGISDHVAGVRTIESYRALRASWFDFILASSLVELILRFNVPGQAAGKEFELLKGTLYRVMLAEAQRDKVLISRIFLWRLLALGGWEPNLDQCALCRASLAEVDFFYEPLRGFVCREHATEGMPVNRAMKVFLRNMLSNDDWYNIMQQASSDELLQSWYRLSQRYYQDVISTPLGSLKLFNYV